MKRILAIALIATVLLCGCNCTPAELPPANFTGTAEGYVYYHENERDRLWEDDIITLAADFLSSHPYLVNEETRIRYADSYVSGNIQLWWENHYDAEKHDLFLSEINSLIPRIPELTDELLPFEIQRVIASLGDAHSLLSFPRGDAFPLSFLPFYEEEKTAVRVVALPREYESLLYAQLTAINGVPVEEVLNRIRPYTSHESEGYFLNLALDQENGAWLTRRNMLEIIGILEMEENTAEFTFLTEAGETVTQTFTALPSEERKSLEMADHSVYMQHAFSYATWEEGYYWYQYLENKNALYIRINSFDSNPEYPLYRMCGEIGNLINDTEYIDKVIVDLRSNPGGYLLDGYTRLFQLLNHRKVGQVYGLINESAMSQTVTAAYNIQNSVEDALLVGTPAGQGVPYCAHYQDTFPTLPNCGLTYAASKIQTVSETGNHSAPIQPDILVYPTLEDYKNGIDTVLEYALNLN